MFKTASRRAAGRQRPSRFTPSEHATCAVIAFRRGHDNHGRPCVYRRVWTFRDRLAAQRKAEDLVAGGYGCAGVVAKGDAVPERVLGDKGMVLAWYEQAARARRRDPNHRANPWDAAEYELRNLGLAKSWDEDQRRPRK